MNSPQIRDPTLGTGKCVLHFPWKQFKWLQNWGMSG